MVAPVVLIEGVPATPEALAQVALVNYGAYTSFRVEDGRVRGLAEHLTRLQVAAVELFGEAVADARLRALIHAAAAGQGDCWLRVSLFSPEISPRSPAWTGVPKVMIAVSPAPLPLATSVRLQSQVYAREAAHLKHGAVFGLIRARRLARAAGFDDAVFVDDQGRVSEGSLWNIGFYSGDVVVWPRAPMLAGVAQALITRGLASVGLSSATRPVGLSDVSAFDGAFLCNSATPACAVAAIDARTLAVDPAMTDRIAAAWASNPADPV